MVVRLPTCIPVVERNRNRISRRRVLIEVREVEVRVVAPI